MARPTGTTPDMSDSPLPGGSPDDITDWLDWDHWQGVEELQTIVDGLVGPLLDDPAEDGEAASEASRRQLRRHLHRRGIELEA